MGSHCGAGLHTALGRLRAMLVGQFQMREATTAQVEHRMDPPVGSLAAWLVDVGAIDHPQDAAWPVQGAGVGVSREQLVGQRFQERDGLVAAVFDGGVAHVREAEQFGPGGCLLQRQPAGAACQGEAQQGETIVPLARPFDCLGLPGQVIQIQPGGEKAKQFSELIGREGGCFVMHLPPESYRFEPCQMLI